MSDRFEIGDLRECWRIFCTVFSLNNVILVLYFLDHSFSSSFPLVLGIFVSECSILERTTQLCVKGSNGERKQ